MILSNTLSLRTNNIPRWVLRNKCLVERVQVRPNVRWLLYGTHGCSFPNSLTFILFSNFRCAHTRSSCRVRRHGKDEPGHHMYSVAKYAQLRAKLISTTRNIRRLHFLQRSYLCAREKNCFDTGEDSSGYRVASRIRARCWWLYGTRTSSSTLSYWAVDLLIYQV